MDLLRMARARYSLLSAMRTIVKPNITRVSTDYEFDSVGSRI